MTSGKNLKNETATGEASRLVVEVTKPGFTSFSPETLQSLKDDGALFYEEGQAIPYQICKIKVQDNEELISRISLLRSEIEMHSQLTRHRNAIENLEKRLERITQEEISTACACNTREKWAEIDPEVRRIMSRMSQGIEITGNELLTFKNEGQIKGSLQCLLKSFGLYQEFQRLFNLKG
ncbi:hypothetical protein O4H49_06050 [Kiloniella laminariae]|uniref:Uncharacterized protein n=1 Tax=Kiloniella laminariae TaxID=454162 RepID=A0ABT4LGW1_9PROT|nr:hypothetical protein [Kiloniella laminariae]MCZ4280329.1 hypothetical protein [Kiloniella laminariae]